VGGTESSHHFYRVSMPPNRCRVDKRATEARFAGDTKFGAVSWGGGQEAAAMAWKSKPFGQEAPSQLGHPIIVFAASSSYCVI
jgi:hypothetical protein